MAYDTDLAEIHHLHYDEVAVSAAKELLHQLDNAGVTSGLIVDLGCGSGVTARLLTDAGFEVLGVDIAPEMIRLARNTAPKATFQCASLFDVEIPPCVAVTAISESVNFAFDDRTSAEEIGALIGRIYDALEPKGIAMLDVAGPERVEPGSSIARYEGDGWYIVVETIGEESGDKLTRNITVFRARDGAWHRSDEVHEQRLYSPEVVTDQLLSAGFDVVFLSGYAELTFPRGWAGFVARKRKR